METKENVHVGHRQRMREKVNLLGFENLPAHEQLEYFLFVVIPRANTNELAHSLIKKFGTLTEIFNAPLESLMQIKGIGLKVARYLKEIPVFSRAYFNIRAKEVKFIKSPNDVINMFKPVLQVKDVEELSVVCLDNMGKVLCFKNLAKGSTDQVEYNPHNLINLVSSCMAKNVILMHNHPFGEAVASNEDIANTQKIYYSLNSINVCLLDHYIFNTAGEMFSFSDSGWFSAFDKSFGENTSFKPAQSKMSQFKRMDKIKNA